MISTLAQAGKSIGITANGNKVIRNVLDGVLEAATELGASVHCIQKVTEDEPNLPRLQFTTDNAELLAAIGTSSQVAAGTAWLWARSDARESMDTLFIDEAAQMSLNCRRYGHSIGTDCRHACGGGTATDAAIPRNREADRTALPAANLRNSLKLSVILVFFCKPFRSSDRGLNRSKAALQ
jgi:hypothetical protein